MSSLVRLTRLIGVLFVLGVSVVHAGTPEEDRNKAAAVAYYHTQNTADWAAARKYLADNYVDHHPSAPPGAGVDYVERMYQGWSRSKHTSAVLKAVARGDTVALYLRDWTEFLGRTTAIVAFFRFDKDGKITDHWHIGQRVGDPLNNNGMF